MPEPSPKRPAAWIHSIATAVPEPVVTEETVLAYLGPWLKGSAELEGFVRDLIGAQKVERRHMAFTPEELLADHGLEWMNREYARRLVPLAETASREALAKAGLLPTDVDLVLSTSCTGFMIPPLDAHLANRMGMRGDLKRLPITELGCAGGAAAVARAADLIAGNPDLTILCISAELPSATFQARDLSRSNLVASLLFGDGVAAFVMSGREPRRRHPSGHPRVLASRSALFPDSMGLMGFDLKASGFHLILSPRIPAVVKREVRPVVDALLGASGASRADLSFFVLHPGGRKVLECLEETLEVSRAQAASSWRTLADYGNLSSAMVIFILRDLWESGPPPAGARGLLAAFGPGFGAEVSLLGWQ